MCGVVNAGVRYGFFLGTCDLVLAPEGTWAGGGEYALSMGAFEATSVEMGSNSAVPVSML